ncbi:MAG: DNA mismatch repair protein MutS [Dehalococcoidales bacterium]|nr:DNA mismatch repair protein MutS [Dehalococcoidales bacterium]
MKDDVTPIRRQYLRIKKQYPHAIVLFRLGDFYETFDEDARITSRELEIVLTSREMGKGNKIPLAGIPYHALDGYLARLINRGYKVAICEQLTKPGETKGLVERDVVRLVTPGTIVEPNLLDSKTNNYLVSLAVGEGEVGLAYVDITTSEFAVTQLPLARAKTELQRLNPSEVIASENADLDALEIDANITRLDGYRFDLEVARLSLLDHFSVATLEGYGCANLPLAIRAAGAIIYYIGETQKAVGGQLTHLTTYTTDNYMALDEQTQRNLEIFHGARSGSLEGSLLSVLDATKTPMGGRLLRKWLGQPLLDIEELNKRLDAIEWFTNHALERRQIIDILKNVADLERLINRIRSEIAIPRELVTLRRSLEAIPKIREILSCHPERSEGYRDGEADTAINWVKDELKPLQTPIDIIVQAIVDEPSSSLGEGGVIRHGFSEELDNLREVSGNAKKYLAGLELKERERTGIKNLRVGFNNVFGYYIEVSNANLNQVPEDYIRKQTLVNGERFFTPELKEYESMILNARDRIEQMETDLYRRVCRQIAAESDGILALGSALAHLDAFTSLAEVAVHNNYIRPLLDEGNIIDIKQGRHPVVERSLTDGSFVPNDIYLSNDDAQLIVLTGPNMSGKSTYLRQVALIVLMAQIGSFVPASSARIGIVDRIFTRIGARDDLAAGQSTFMVEMVETANILNNATSRSLLILDEIGRGTSTYDGLSIARAVAEYIHDYKGLGARTVFATHYHEMVALAAHLPRVKNFNVAVIEEAGHVIFLHKIVPGGVDKSYGIHVAQLAGLPKAVLHRAREVLNELESDGKQPKPSKSPKEPTAQIPLFGEKSELEKALDALDVDSLTPLEALNKLHELKKKLGK